MKTRAKFKCDETAQIDWGDRVVHRAKFSAVYGNSEENKKFFAASPNGRLELDVVAEQHFKAGKEYYIDITEAE